MLRNRSGKPTEEKDLEVWLAEQNLKNQRASLELSKRRLNIDLEQNAVDIIRLKAALDQAIRIREESLVRSPIDGVVTQINSRQGEMASGVGIAKVVDMRGTRFAWHGKMQHVRLDPADLPFAIWRVTPTGARPWARVACARPTRPIPWRSRTSWPPAPPRSCLRRSRSAGPMTSGWQAGRGARRRKRRSRSTRCISARGCGPATSAARCGISPSSA